MTTDRPVYLDYNGSTPIHPQVAAAMLPYLSEAYGNPSSGHWAGEPARDAVDRARAQLAGLLGCSSHEIVFTSGGTEADNAALLGVFYASGRSAPHIITTQIEHPAVLEPCRFLQRLGARVTVVGVDAQGLADPDDIRRALRPETVLVSVMHANNEVGTIQPIEDIAAIVREAGVPFHTDAAQSVGKLPTRVDHLGADLLSLAGHKFYAPKGVGALYVREGVRLEPLLHGAGHEDGRRAGTENVLLDVALGEAADLAGDLSWTVEARRLRDWLWTRLQERFGDRVLLNGHPTRRLPNTLNVSFLGRRGPDLLAALPAVAATTGSACHTGVTASPVLTAMGVPAEAAAGAVRLSLGRMTTQDELDGLLERIDRLAVSPAP
jgi:cysteine desulfurase